MIINIRLEKMKTKTLNRMLSVVLIITLNTITMAQQRPYTGENDPQIFKDIRKFLKTSAYF